MFWSFEIAWSRKAATFRQRGCILTTGSRKTPRQKFQPSYLAIKRSDSSTLGFIPQNTYLRTILWIEAIRKLLDPEKAPISRARTRDTRSASQNVRLHQGTFSSTIRPFNRPSYSMIDRKDAERYLLAICRLDPEESSFLWARASAKRPFNVSELVPDENSLV